MIKLATEDHNKKNDSKNYNAISSFDILEAKMKKQKKITEKNAEDPCEKIT